MNTLAISRLYAISGFRCFLMAGLIFSLAHGAQAAIKDCADQECFLEQLGKCEPAMFFTPMVAGGLANYSVLGPGEGVCAVEVVFLDHPDPGLANEPLSFVIDPQGELEFQLKEAVASCLEGEQSEYQCSGVLWDKISAASNAVEIRIAVEPPCGVDSGEEGSALYPMPRGDKWGYVNRDGSWAIEPQWAYAEPFSEGRAVVDNGNLWGIIDRQGNYVLEPVLRSSSCSASSGNPNSCSSPLQPFSQGCSKANIQKDGSPHPFFVDRDGRFWLDDALPADLQGKDIWEFGDFSGGRAWFQAMGEGLKESFGWIDSQGRVVLSDRFSGAGNFANGLAPAASGGDYWAFIDESGNPVMPSSWKYRGAMQFSEGFAATEIKPFEWVYFNSEGAIAIENVMLNPAREVLGKSMQAAHFQAAGDFHDGLAPVLPKMMFDAEEVIYIRPDGTEAFAPASRLGVEVCQYTSLPEFRNGLLQLLVAGEGADCEGARPGRAMPDEVSARYIYLDTSGNIALDQTHSD